MSQFAIEKLSKKLSKCKDPKSLVNIAFMAFVCVRYLEYQLATLSNKVSPEVIRKSLLKVQASVIKDNQTNKSYLLPSRITLQAKEIYRVIGIKIPSGIMQINAVPLNSKSICN